MALTKDMELWQIKSFLEEEVKEQVFLEIAPLLYIGQEVGGYFGVTRQILCLVDFLGALYCGYDGKTNKKTGRMIISEPWKAVKFIEEILGDVDQKYRENGEILFNMYRHGLVHLYQPRTVRQQNGRELKWAIYKGARERANVNFKTDEREFTIPDARHLGISTNPSDKKSDLLTISITCLYKDLLSAIDKYYFELLEKDEKWLKNWQSTANAISKSEEYLVIKSAGGDMNE